MTSRDHFTHEIESASEAIQHRLDPRTKLSSGGERYRGMSMLEICREHLALRGINTRGMDRMSLATTALQTRSGLGTSDLANVLMNVARKRLRQSYEENPGSFRRWARQAPNVPDFKQVSVAQLSAMPDLLQVNEHGEFKYGALYDTAEKYNLLTYGRLLSISRQAIVNDDLRAFDRVVTGFGAAAARLENRTVYAQLTANGNTSDGNPLFSAAHSNNGTGAGSALQFSALTAMRAAMRGQKGMQTEELNLAPAYLIVPASLEQSAYQLTSAQYTPAKATDINEFRGGGRTSLEPVVEPILDTGSPATWYAACAAAQCDTVEYAYLDGAEGPVVETQQGFEVDGVTFKCRLDFAAKAIDWRGLYRAVGS
jgi:hypothetical protein